MIKVLNVSQINYYIKSILEGDKNLLQVYVSGEISNLTKHSSGHIYLSLKDKKSVLKSIIFNGSNRLKFDIQEGMNVIARGKITLYEPTGQYQLIIEDIQPNGIGTMAIAFEQLKKKLSQEGLFDENNKKPIPKIPYNIGVITSPMGAVIQDIKNVLSRRFPLVKVFLYPVLVQGENASKKLISGVQYFNNNKNVDLIIIARGGGSAEDLFPFNDEKLARTIYNSDIPIISAVGHETDFTICDFVSDLRASTPSVSAELAVPNRYDIIKELSSKSIISYTQKYILDYQQKLEDLYKSLISAYKEIIDKKRQELKLYQSLVESYNPEKAVNRGYSIIYKNNKLIKSVKDILNNDIITIRLGNGEIKCKVSDIEENIYE